jgi:WD40 repeat protein
MLAAAGRDGTLHLWDLEVSMIKATMQEGAFGFQAIAFSPDGNSLAAGGIDRNITLWDVTWILKNHPTDK